MMITKTKALNPLIAALDDVIIAAKSAKLNETAALLRIARLDLLMRVHRISPDELELLSLPLTKGVCKAPPAKPRKKTRVRLH